MPHGNFFYCATCYNLRPSKMLIIMDNGYQYLFKNTKKISLCYVFNFDEWMKNDVSMTLWL